MVNGDRQLGNFTAPGDGQGMGEIAAGNLANVVDNAV